MTNLPEYSNPPELYYNQKESNDYHKNTRIVKIQSEIAERALELLEIKEDHPFLLDIGCGSGLSGRVVSNKGYGWIGLDLSPSMLEIAAGSSENADFLLFDIGQPFPFTDELFDYAISISTVQWLFHSFKSSHNPTTRIRSFFRSLYRCVKNKVAIQFYCSKKEVEILKTEAKRAGFYGGLVTDNEGTKNCKNYLVLSKNKPVTEKKVENRLKKDAFRRAKSE